jgi:threonine/homoserine/homoserine lactone efflux protein
MPLVLHELFVALILGLVGGIIPGPVITSVFTEIIQSGFPKSLRIIFTALVAETAVAAISLLFLVSMDLNEGFFRGLSLAGAVILLWIARSLWNIRSLETGKMVTFGLGKIIAMILTNGVLWTYWITICIPRAVLLQEQVAMGAWYFMGMVQLGWLISTTLTAFAFSRFRGVLDRPRALPVMFRIFSLAFVYFALDMTWKSIRYFLTI